MGRFFRIAALSLCVLAAAASIPASVAEPLSPAQKKAVEQTIREYLLANPEIIVDAFQALQVKRQAAERSVVRAALDANRAELFTDPTSPVSGDARGDVTMVEFFDYRCGVCKRVHPVIAELMKTDPRLKRVYKEWPILGPESMVAARAALASRAQGKYLRFHNAMMEAKGRLDRKKVFAIADSVGIDGARLATDMESPKITAIIRRVFKLADALKINGTPSFVIGNEVLRGGRDIDTLRKIIADVRAGK